MVTKAAPKLAADKPATRAVAKKKAGATKVAATAPARKQAVKPAGKPTLPSVPARKRAGDVRAVAARAARASGVPAGEARKITPKQALANTRKLLEVKRAHDRQAQPWQKLDPEHDHVAQAGFQSPEAAQKAEELHAAESRKEAIQGSISTQDRHAQGKRDAR